MLGSYKQQSFSKISFNVSDDLSGILNENNVSLFIDNVPNI